MSKQIRVLELNNCISSRLWYTSLNIFNTSNDSKFLKEFHYNCCVDLTELKTVIESLSTKQKSRAEKSSAPQKGDINPYS